MASNSRVVYHAPRDIRIEAMPAAPSPGPGEVLVRVLACAVCGSDIKTYLNGNPRLKPPQTMGHEFCGVIESVGSSVQNYRPGQRVSMATTMGCGTCRECRIGKPNICSNLEAMGFHHNGAMAPWALIPERGVSGGNLVDVGDLEPTYAALCEPTSCVVNSLSQLEGRDCQNVLVIGLGPLGLIHCMMARDVGIGTVVGAARPGARFDAAKGFGLDAVVTPDEIPAAIERFTDGAGFDAVVVTAPSAEIQSQAPEFAAKSGAISLFAGLPKGAEMITLNSRTVHYGEQTIYGTSDSTVAHVRKAAAWLAAHTDAVDRLVTHRLSISRFHDGLQAVLDRQAIKVVLTPEE